MNRIRAIRVERNLSQKELAEKTGLSQVNVSRYEKGQRKLEIQTAARIAEALGCTVDELITKETA